MATNGKVLFVSDPYQVAVFELTLDGTVSGQTQLYLAKQLHVVGEDLFILSYPHPTMTLFRWRPHGPLATTEALGTWGGEPSSSVLADNGGLVWFDRDYYSGSLLRWDFSGRTAIQRYVFSTAIELFAARGDSVYASKNGQLVTIDLVTDQTSSFASAAFNSKLGCAIGADLYFLSSDPAYPKLYTMPLAGSSAPRVLASVPTAGKGIRMLCDGDVFVAVSDGKATQLARYTLPSGPYVDVAATPDPEVGGIVRVGEVLYWTLPNKGVIARVDL